MAVITVSRQLGSLGCAIVDAVSDRLGYRVAWRGLINRAARRARTPEMALEILDELGLLGLKPSLSSQKAYLAAIRELIEELAREGDVLIVGRGGQAVLHGWPNTLHIRIVAPEDVRVKRLAERDGISAGAALAQIRASDRRRKRFVERAYHVDWADPAYYDLVINTASLDVLSSAGLICHAVTSIPETKKSHHGSDH
ncbi:MAG TPA: cytidylate kinase-like family protein [Anaerolineales bacterium]|nr:cytidylate kinase-like family protein [Anaerolineales bacterium]